MSLEDITLPTNKSETRVSNNRRTIRSGEKGLSIKVTLVDANDQPYDLSAFTLEFNEIKDQGKIVFDSGSGDNSGSFNVVDAKGGVFTYTLAPQVYSASGRAWFVIKQDDTIIDTTKDFYFDVLQDATIHIDNDNYVSSMEAELDAFKAMTQKEQQNADALIKSLTDQMNEAIADGNTKEADALADAKSKLQALQDATGKLNDDWTAELNTQKQNFTTLQSQWDSELQSIQAKANTDTDSAVKAINDRYTNDFAKLQSDFTNWQTSTTQNYQKQVDAILAKVQQEGTEVADVQKQVDAAVTKMQDLNKQFSNIDFTQFLKPSALDNYYTKPEVDSKLSTTGAVKTVDKIQPDSSGNVQTDHYTKAEVDSKVSALNQAITPVYVNSRDDVAAQDAYIVIVDDDN